MFQTQVNNFFNTLDAAVVFGNWPKNETGKRRGELKGSVSLTPEDDIKLADGDYLWLSVHKGPRLPGTRQNVEGIQNALIAQLTAGGVDPSLIKKALAIHSNKED